VVKFLLLFLWCSIAQAFQSFDSTQFRTDHPYLGSKLPVISECELMGQCDNTNTAPVEATIKRRLAKYIGAEAVVLDFESWYPIQDKKLISNAARNAAWYALVLRWSREALPGTKIGFFGFPILARYSYIWPETYMADYMKAHQLMLPILNASDVLYPELYLWFKESQLYSYEAWTITLGRMLGKPVVPFMWHKDPKIVTSDLSDIEIDGQCNFLRRNADGVAWWSKYSETYDQNSTWVKAAANCIAVP